MTLKFFIAKVSNSQQSTVNSQQIILKFVSSYVNKIKLRWSSKCYQ